MLRLLAISAMELCLVYAEVPSILPIRRLMRLWWLLSELWRG